MRAGTTLTAAPAPWCFRLPCQQGMLCCCLISDVRLQSSGCVRMYDLTRVRPPPSLPAGYHGCAFLSVPFFAPAPLFVSTPCLLQLFYRVHHPDVTGSSFLPVSFRVQFLLPPVSFLACCCYSLFRPPRSCGHLLFPCRALFFFFPSPSLRCPYPRPSLSHDVPGYVGLCSRGSLPLFLIKRHPPDQLPLPAQAPSRHHPLLTAVFDAHHITLRDCQGGEQGRWLGRRNRYGQGVQVRLEGIG